AVKKFKKMSPTENSIEKILELTNVYISVKERLYYRLKQITKYNWLSKKFVKKCLKTIPFKNVIYNYEFDEFIYHSPEFSDIKFTSSVDAINDDSIWIIKCCENIITEQLLHLVVISWIWNKNMA